jgi:hypothetical protein
LLIGAVLGALLGVAGALREAAEGYPNRLVTEPWAAIGPPAVAGAVIGAILFLARGLQNGRPWRYYLSWAIAGMGGVASGLAVDGLQVVDVVLVLLLGLGGGLGCALFFRQILGGYPALQPLPLPDD